MHSPYRICIEGAELVGKSFITHEIYSALEPTQNSNTPFLLDGCHWFNCDIGIFGTHAGKPMIQHYIELLDHIPAHVLFEKFHIADQVYAAEFNKKIPDYQDLEKTMLEKNMCIIFLEADMSDTLLERRLQDRINLYPHYKARPYELYQKQHELYETFIQKTTLPYLRVDTSTLPNQKIIDTILTWLQKN